MLISVDKFKRLFQLAREPEKWAELLDGILPQFGLDLYHKERLIDFLAQTAHESGGYSVTQENLNYSADRLIRIWPCRFDAAKAEKYARHPEDIANCVYANRLGNGDEASGDGWRYRGRGLLQLTGKDNYERFDDWCRELNIPLHPIDTPDELAKPQGAIYSACFFWQTNGCSAITDFKALTKRINGGLIGLDDRIAWRQRIAKALAQG